MPTIYIKIKHLKQFLLIMACVFLASFNYLTYAENTGADLEICDKTTDYDCDGLLNTEETLYGTDPYNLDSDGDGYSDGVEVKSGFDPLKPAPDDKLATVSPATTDKETAENTSSSSGDKTTSATDDFSKSLSSFISSKNGQQISETDINNFVNEQMKTLLNESLTTNDLPAIDVSKIKILKQDYSALSADEKKQKLSEDCVNYLQKMFYLLVNNSPTQLLTTEDFTTFQENFLSHLASLPDGNVADYEYFSDLGDRLEIFLSQTESVEVPETMLDLHVKFLRITKGLLTLRDSSSTQSSFGDSIGEMMILSKAKAYINLYSDFFQNDFQNYFEKNNISTTS